MDGFRGYDMAEMAGSDSVGYEVEFGGSLPMMEIKGFRVEGKATKLTKSAGAFPD